MSMSSSSVQDCGGGVEHQILSFERRFWLNSFFERRFFALRKRRKTQKPPKNGPYPSDLHGIGCKITGKTGHVVPIMVPRPENTTRIQRLKIYRTFKTQMLVEIVTLDGENLAPPL
jgi:hypothetical protein